MLEQILDYIHNYFECRKVKGTFSIIDGSLDGSEFLQEGQYFRIVGSVFNNGVWNTADTLHDETFCGEVWALAIPPRLTRLAGEIDDWVNANKEVLESPYQSESFGGYSYTKGGGGGNGAGNGCGWQDVFGSQLNQWRKIS